MYAMIGAEDKLKLKWKSLIIGDFLATNIPAVVNALSNGVELVNKLYDQVTSYIEKRKESKSTEEHSLKIESNESGISAIENNKVVKTITGADILNLPDAERRHILVLEQSMQNHYDLWAQVYPIRDASPDPIVNAKVNQQLKSIIFSMKDDLNGILGFLESMNIHLDDHYKQFRYLVNQV